LVALDAKVTLRSFSGERVVPLDEFYLGVRRTVMRPDEMMVDIAFPALGERQRGTFIKLGLRQAQAIALINVAMMLTLDENKVENASITLGAIAPTIIHAVEAERYITGRVLDDESITRTAELAMGAAQSIDDVRASADYRDEMVRICAYRGLKMIRNGEEKHDFPVRPVLLWGRDYHGEVVPLAESITQPDKTQIETRINGKQYTFESGYEKTLLRLLREDAGLFGTKEGCAEGECGACTVFLDGMAVMSCLVPAPRAHGADIVTIEGLAENGRLHPVQQAFVDEGAVQCGYCTPGFIMSAAKLLEENAQPHDDEIRQAITGNLCRCTGYYMIVNAIEKAAQEMASHGMAS
jgi:carbon-monoxide dehydrogenase medium subunit